MTFQTQVTHAASARALLLGSIALAVTSLMFLASLHVLAPELDPSWHMVSEYAFGSHGLALSVFFWCWGLASMAVALGVYPLATTRVHKLGAALVFVSGVGACAGGLFDIRHELHGLAFALGIPTLPAGALMLTSLLTRLAPGQRTLLRAAAHTTWLSILGMAVSMALFIASLKAAGAFNPESKEVLKELPAGVSTVVGYANRFLVVAYIGWLMTAAVTVQRGTRSAKD